MALSRAVHETPRKREGRPSFWERPSRALPDRKDTAAGTLHPSPTPGPMVKSITLSFQRRLADFSRHVGTENHGHDDSCWACLRPSQPRPARRACRDPSATVVHIGRFVRQRAAGGFQVEAKHLRKRGSAGYELVAAELRGPGNSTTTESNSPCNEALMIG
jgi:hypothetical protein